MPYTVQSKKSGKTYFLHSRRQPLKGGHIQTLYFFATEPKDGAMDTMPQGYKLTENEKTGLPLLCKS